MPAPRDFDEIAIATLLTDFGLRESYVGAVKGTLLRLSPECQLVDLCHEVHPGDVESAGAAARAEL